MRAIFYEDSRMISKSFKNFVSRSVWGIHLKKIPRIDGTWTLEFDIKQVWKLTPRQLSRRLL